MIFLDLNMLVIVLKVDGDALAKVHDVSFTGKVLLTKTKVRIMFIEVIHCFTIHELNIILKEQEPKVYHHQDIFISYVSKVEACITCA